MAETGAATLRKWLLTAVAGLDGGRRAEVHARVEEIFGDQFTAEDRAPRVGRRGEPAWRNNLDSLYDRLKKTGVMAPSQQGGVWRLSPTGAREVAALGPAPVTEDDILSEFKPNSGGEYLAHLRGRTLMKTRDHDPLLRSYGHDLTRHGWRPKTTVHPRDLELVRGPRTWLGEVKIVYSGNATRAAREAMAQLQEYRYFFYSPDDPPGLLALFSEDIGPALSGLLGTLGIASVWRTQSGWEGTAWARSEGLVPAT